MSSRLTESIADATQGPRTQVLSGAPAVGGCQRTVQAGGVSAVLAGATQAWPRVATMMPRMTPTKINRAGWNGLLLLMVDGDNGLLLRVRFAKAS